MISHGLRLALVVTLALGSAAPATAQVDFAASRNATPGVSAVQGVLADFDEDGFVDLLTSVSSASVTHGLDFYRGTGRGTFGAARRVFNGVARIEGITDFDEDGHLDLLVFMIRLDGSDFVAVFLGDGEGYFTDGGAPFGAPISDVWYARTMRLPGDSHADVAVLGYDGSGPVAATYRGDGAGAFTFAGLTALGAQRELVAVLPSDLSGDGGDDLALLLKEVGTQSTDVAVTLSTGAGALLPPAVVRSVHNAKSIAAGDFDEDGEIDLAHVELNPGSGALHFGDGTGVFPTFVTFTASGGGFSSTAADLNSDGHADLLAGDAPNGTVAIHSGDGAGALSSPVLVFAGDSPRHPLVADLDEDGDLDIVAMTEGGATVLLRSGESDDGAPRLPLGSAPRDALLADFDEDGRLDLVTGASPTEIRRGDGSLGFGPPQTVAPGPGHSVRAADMDSDGHLDLVAARVSASQAHLTFVPGLGPAGFGVPVTQIIAGDFVDSAVIEIGDFDGDSVPDVLCGITEEETAFSDGSFVSFRSGQGDGTVGERQMISAFTYLLAGLGIADFDGDGSIDVVMLEGDVADELYVAFGRGDGTFESDVVLDPPVRPESLCTGDTDGDGRIDLIVQGFETGAPPNPSRVVTMHADAARVFSIGASADVGSLSPSGRLSVSDLDQSGTGDVVVVTPNEGCATILLSEVGRTLAPPRSFLAGAGARVHAIGDLDGDGLVDLAVACGVSTDLALLRNETGELDFYASRRGNVNAGAGPVANVLLFNESPGFGIARRIVTDRLAPAAMRVASPPSRDELQSPFAMYVWRRAPSPGDGRVLPAGLGASTMPMPFGPNPVPAPRWLWNSIGMFPLLGSPTFPSGPAPRTLFARPAGLPAAGTFFFQGVIFDDDAPNGRAAVTNAIELVVR